MANDFGFIRATDPLTVPSTGSLVRASISGIQPNKLPEYLPDGPALNNLDGSTSFPALASFVISYENLSIPDATLMYNEYVGAASNTNALVWVRRFNVKIGVWETVLATMHTPTVAEEIGPLYRGYSIKFDGIGVNTNAVGYQSGQQFVSTSSGVELPDTWYGRGLFGSGRFGY